MYETVGIKFDALYMCITIIHFCLIMSFRSQEETRGETHASRGGKGHRDKNGGDVIAGEHRTLYIFIHIQVSKQCSL